MYRVGSLVATVFTGFCIFCMMQLHAFLLSSSFLSLASFGCSGHGVVRPVLGRLHPHARATEQLAIYREYNNIEKVINSLCVYIPVPNGRKYR